MWLELKKLGADEYSNYITIHIINYSILKSDDYGIIVILNRLHGDALSSIASLNRLLIF